MILEFLLVSDPDSGVMYLHDAPAAPRAGDKVYLQTEKNQPYVDYVVDHVEWQVDADGSMGAIAYLLIYGSDA